MNRPPFGVTLRWVVAGLAGVGGVFLLMRVPMDDGNWDAFHKLLGGLAGLFTGALLISPELVRWLLTPLSGLIDSILLLSEEAVPPADLKLARFYVQSLRHAEAAEEYARVLQYHPDYTDAYLEGIRAAGLAGDERLAKKFYHDAQRALRGQEQRHSLEGLYAARHEPLRGMEEAAFEALPEQPAEDVPPEKNLPPR